LVDGAHDGDADLIGFDNDGGCGGLGGWCVGWGRGSGCGAGGGIEISILVGVTEASSGGGGDFSVSRRVMAPSTMAAAMPPRIICSRIVMSRLSMGWVPWIFVLCTSLER
jgi:hypothetical protein